MPDKNGNALRGEPGHWRYKKDIETSAKKHGTTGMNNLGIKLRIAEHPAVKKENNKKTNTLKDRTFSKKGAKALNRKEQLLIIRMRNVPLIKPLKRCKEADLIEMILNSNPEAPVDDKLSEEEDKLPEDPEADPGVEELPEKEIEEEKAPE